MTKPLCIVQTTVHSVFYIQFVGKETSDLMAFPAFGREKPLGHVSEKEKNQFMQNFLGFTAGGFDEELYRWYK